MTTRDKGKSADKNKNKSQLEIDYDGTQELNELNKRRKNLKEDLRQGLLDDLGGIMNDNVQHGDFGGTMNQRQDRRKTYVNTQNNSKTSIHVIYGVILALVVLVFGTGLMYQHTTISLLEKENKTLMARLEKLEAFSRETRDEQNRRYLPVKSIADKLQSK